jgi:hypothetical protein
MKRTSLALAFAVIAEVVLGVVFLKFGKFSMERSGSHNLIGSLIGNFHMPGYLLAKSLRIPKELGMIFIVITGAVQLFLLALVLKWLLKALQGKDPTSSKRP